LAGSICGALALGAWALGQLNSMGQGCGAGGGQPKVVDEDGKDYKYLYPRTIQHDILKRPNLPPPPYEVPGIPHQL
jgi:hypothetical protein